MVVHSIRCVVRPRRDAAKTKRAQKRCTPHLRQHTSTPPNLGLITVPPSGHAPSTETTELTGSSSSGGPLAPCCGVLAPVRASERASAPFGQKPGPPAGDAAAPQRLMLRTARRPASVYEFRRVVGKPDWLDGSAPASCGETVQRDAHKSGGVVHSPCQG